MGTSPVHGKPERIYYIRYRKEGKLIEEKAGRQSKDDISAARAAQIRARRMRGDYPSNKEKREEIKAQKKAEEGKWVLNKLRQEYKAQRPHIKGLRSDVSRYRIYLQPLFGEKKPSEIMQLDVDRLRIRLLKKRAPQTVKHVLASLKRIIRFGEIRGSCDALNFQIELPMVRNQKNEDLTPEKLKALLKTIDADKNTQAANMMKLALFTGMRKGEILKLEWQNVDFQRGFISIGDPKGGPDQKIPMNDAARDIL
jgi:integrase